MLRQLFTRTWHVLNLAGKAIMEKMSAPSKITRPVRDAPQLAAEPIRKRKILFKAGIRKETLATDILRSIGKHPTKPPLNHEMFPFVGCYINKDSDLGTIDMSKTRETIVDNHPTSPWELTPPPSGLSSTSWDLNCLGLSLPSSGLTLPASGLKFPSSELIIPSSSLSLTPTGPSPITFDPHFHTFNPGVLNMNQQPLTVDPRHLVLESRPLAVDPIQTTRVQPSPIVQPPTVAQPPVQARRPVYVSRNVQEPYPDMIMSVLNFLRDNGMNETADEFECEMILRGWTTLFERDGVVIQVDRSLEDRVREAMGRNGWQSTRQGN